LSVFLIMHAVTEGQYPNSDTLHLVKFYLEYWNLKTVVVTTLLNSSFVYIRLFSAAARRMTPSLPQRGKQPMGSIPLTPSFFGICFNLIRSYRNRGFPERRGWKHEKLGPPRAIVCFHEDFNRAVITFLFLF
jgi:hypothetical protein